MDHPRAARPPVDPRPRRRWAWVVPVLVPVALVVVFVLVGRQPSAGDAVELPPAPPPAGPAPDGMAWVPGGAFWMGDPASPDADAPWHRVEVDGFWMDRTEVTNAAFAAFVAATGYQTVSERMPTREQYPDAKPESLVAGSAVFRPTRVDGPALGSPPVWWAYVPGADWRHPEGPASDLTGRADHPVVHVAWDDAVAYAAWAGKRLPTEAEWECAARGGLDRAPFAWGDRPQGAGGAYFANTYQGRFPEADRGADGFTGTAPVGTFPANGYGLSDLSGNAWEWCADWYDKDSYAAGPKRNPAGPAGPAAVGAGSRDPASGQPQRVRRGGSFLCADDYCKRYLPGTRDKNPPDSAASHTGFRCVRNAH